MPDKKANKKHERPQDQRGHNGAKPQHKRPQKTEKRHDASQSAPANNAFADAFARAKKR